MEAIRATLKARAQAFARMSRIDTGQDAGCQAVKCGWGRCPGRLGTMETEEHAGLLRARIVRGEMTDPPGTILVGRIKPPPAPDRAVHRFHEVEPDCFVIKFAVDQRGNSQARRSAFNRPEVLERLRLEHTDAEISQMWRRGLDPAAHPALAPCLIRCKECGKWNLVDPDFRVRFVVTLPAVAEYDAP